MTNSKLGKKKEAMKSSYIFYKSIPYEDNGKKIGMAMNVYTKISYSMLEKMSLVIIGCSSTGIL